MKPILVLFVTTITLCSFSYTRMAAAQSGDPFDDLPMLGELKPFISGSAGNAAITVDRAFLLRSIGTLQAPESHCFVVVPFTFKNLFTDPVIPRQEIRVRIEDGPQTIPGWDMNWEATYELSKRLPAFWDVPIERNKSVRAVAVFTLPQATKGLWVSFESKIGAHPEKVFSGGLRGPLGDMPGEERIRETLPGSYRTIIGSFWIKKYADRFAEVARKKGLNAWIEMAPKPRGMYVVVIRHALQYHEACMFLDIARENGYHDAFVLPPVLR